VGTDADLSDVDALLAQATCAVRGRSGSSRGTALGTAWLAKDDGYLLTAGHVVEDLVADGEVWVRFPDETDDERATFAVPPVNDEAAALDFAVLALDAPNGRTPLPLTLMSRAEGQVRARGYGSNLPHAQSAGEGILVGNYLRKARSASYYFQYNTDTLAVGGFSGAAVYSEVANAVIGLQVEEVGGRSAFAMPLARITDHWRDLLETALTPSRGRAVLVQPAAASDEARDTLRERIVRPVLEQLNLALYVSELGGSHQEDMAQLELADVVIADVTHGDPHVIYELTVAQGLGTPDVVVVDAASPSAEAETLFELLRLDLGDVPAARRAVEQRLVAVRSIFEALGDVTATNPLTSFFKAPLTQISAAHALALGYERNFVRPVGTLLLEALEYGDAAGVEVVVDGEPVSTDRLGGITLTVVMPRHLSWAGDTFIQERLGDPGHVVDAVVRQADLSRQRSMKALVTAPGEPIRLVDPFPTTLATMTESIDERLGGGAAVRGAPAWSALERKEIDRFKSKLVHRLRTSEVTVRRRRLTDVVLVAGSRAVLPGVDLS
jgi:hypothetical protein